MSDLKYADIGEPEDSVIEECSEVIGECSTLIQEICKARRFGYLSFHPDDPDKKTNIDRIRAEMSDCVDAFDKLEVKMRKLICKHK
jgi:hypothetical protein